MTTHFASEYGEDKVLYDLFPDFFHHPKFFVDIGAASPTLGSNTQFLRHLGWQGMVVDADDRWAHQWGEDFIHACVSNVPRVYFEKAHSAFMSRVMEGVPNVATVTLESLLEARGVDAIGLLSIDVEGHEFQVVNSMDLEKHHTEFIIAEYNTEGLGECFEVRNYLEAMGYQVIHQTVANFIYKRV